MSVIAKLACDGCGAIFGVTARPWQKAWGALRAAAAREGWARCRPRKNAAQRDYCPRCRPSRVPAALASQRTDL